jgi:hypothetical protein
MIRLKFNLFRVALWRWGFALSFGPRLLRVLSVQVVKREQSRWRGLRRTDIWENATELKLGRVYGIYFS